MHYYAYILRAFSTTDARPSYFFISWSVVEGKTTHIHICKHKKHAFAHTTNIDCYEEALVERAFLSQRPYFLLKSPQVIFQ